MMYFNLLEVEATFKNEDAFTSTFKNEDQCWMASLFCS